MKEVKSILNSNRWFLYPYVTLASFSSVLLLFMGKNDIHLIINKLNNPFFDWIFKYATTLAEGVGIGAVLLLTLFLRLRWTIIVSSALMCNTVIIYILKKMVFSDVARPKVFFSQLTSWHTVDGIHLHSHMSFPSGHTAAAFTLFFGLAICLKNKKFGLPLFIVSFMVGYSRMYLSQHYLRDVIAGSVVGIIIAILAYYAVKKSNRLNQTSWIDKSLPQVLSK